MGAGGSVADAIHYEIIRDVPEQLTKRGHAASLGNRRVIEMRKTLMDYTHTGERTFFEIKRM